MTRIALHLTWCVFDGPSTFSCVFGVHGAQHVLRLHLASPSRTLYIGVTNDLERRVWEHKQKLVPGFTREYGVDRLVYAEPYPYINDAIAREKQLKNWRRSKKIALIEAENPRWFDLSRDWYTD